MHILDRRRFLARSAKAGVGLASGITILKDSASVRGAPANEKLVLALVGVGRGTIVAQGLAQRGDCEFAYIADVNRDRLKPEGRLIIDAQGGKPARLSQDFRKALDDKAVDAMVIATCQHWHALATVWSCQAGKDVYVEKPASHTCWEGRKMVEAARKYKRIVQVGMQNRSAPYVFEALKFLRAGRLGDIHFCRVYQQRLSNANCTLGPDSAPPAGLDWEMWNGPAPARRFNATLFANKNSFWNYGGGDIEADGVHQLDLARWLCNVDYPRSVVSTGGRYASRGDAEVPDTQVVLYDFGRLTMTMEYTGYTPYMMKSDAALRDGDFFPYWPQNSTRIELYGTKGLMIMGRHGDGWQVFAHPKDRQPVVVAQKKGRFPDAPHQANFVECVRSRRTPNADILEGHRSALASHLGNISYRLGWQKLVFDAKTEQIVGNKEAMRLYRGECDNRKPYVIEENV
jgi:predicted dehydrogenase